jgi:hypothetical protein
MGLTTGKHISREESTMTPLEKWKRWLAVKKLGTRYYPIPGPIAPAFDKQTDLANVRQNELKPMFCPGRNIDLFLDFVDDGFPNGAADIFEDLGVIYLTTGTVMLPLEIFCNMFSHPHVLPHIGNWQREIDGPQHEEGIFSDYHSLLDRRKAQKRSPWPTPPQERVRFQLMQLCCEVVWGFINLHEITHIVHGHVNFIQSLRQSALPLHAVSASSKSASVRGDLVLQAIETWADNMAINVSLGGFLAKSDNRFLQEFFPSSEDRAFIWSFAIYTFFRIWELKIDPTNLWGHHPPTALRFQMAMYCAEEVAASKGNLEKEKFRSAAISGLREAEKAIVSCGGKRIVKEESIGIDDPRVHAHHETIADYFDRVLRVELPKYAFVKMKDDPL